MQICKYSLGVIFMLSTIVTVADCCSSRILLLREHTFKIVHHHKIYNADNDVKKMQSQQMDKISLHSTTRTVERFGQKYIEDSGGNVEEEDLLGSESNTYENADFQPSENITDSNTTNSSALPEEGSNTSSNGQTITDTQYHLVDIYYMDILSFECKGQHFTDFCLNNGRCFQFPIGNHSFFSCECADGYVGERCESKSLNELYLPEPLIDPNKPKIMMARIVFSFPMLIALSLTYLIISIFFVLRSNICSNRSYKKEYNVTDYPQSKCDKFRSLRTSLHSSDAPFSSWQKCSESNIFF